MKIRAQLIVLLYLTCIVSCILVMPCLAGTVIPVHGPSPFTGVLHAGNATVPGIHYSTANAKIQGNYSDTLKGPAISFGRHNISSAVLLSNPPAKSTRFFVKAPVSAVNLSYPTVRRAGSIPAAKPTVNSSEDPGKPVTEANNQFAIELFRYLGDVPGSPGTNLFFSPMSISSALALTYEGAVGTTAGEIQGVFHFPVDNETRRQGFIDVYSGLNKKNKGYTLNTANALWAEKTHPFLPGYIRTASRYYGAKVTNLDFMRQPDPSRMTINRWVADQTANRITGLLPEGSITGQTRLVITNAIYFKGTWALQFDKSQTRDEEFTISPGNTVTVPMMQVTGEEAKFKYADTGTLQAIELPYSHKSGNELSMLVLLPKENDLAAVEDSLTAGGLSELRHSMSEEQVPVYLPRFRLETKYELQETLKAMGMPTAFTSSADFSGMDGTRDLYISSVIHQAYVDVNEGGTEAAGATVVIFKTTSILLPEREFRANHPFVFFIMDNDTGNILFIGRVINPGS